MTLRRAIAVTLLGVLASCGGPSRPTHRRLRPTRGAVVARVGAEPIFAAEVEAVARSRHIAPRAAVDVIADELRLAREADRRALPGDDDEVLGWRAMVQLLLRREVEEAVRESSLPAADVRAVFDQRHAELCHRGLTEVRHVVVLARADAGRAAVDAAMEAARAFRARVVARGGEQPTREIFESEARALPAGCCVAEGLAPFDAEGRTVSGGRYVPEFARAAFGLDARHPLSQPFETGFGVHVALWVSSVPPLERTEDEALAMVRRDMLTVGRARRLRDLLAQLRLRDRVEISESTLRAVDRVARAAPARP